MFIAWQRNTTWNDMVGICGWAYPGLHMQLANVLRDRGINTLNWTYLRIWNAEGIIV
ncbi:hypothetical protein ACA081_01135 [Candidatus Hodgkinia cicadicola]